MKLKGYGYAIIGMVGPKMYCFQPEDRIFALGSFVNWSMGETSNRGMFLPDSELEIPLEAEPVDFIAGCCVLVSRNMLENVGFLDPIYYLNYEDFSYEQMARIMGFSNVKSARNLIYKTIKKLRKIME